MKFAEKLRAGRALMNWSQQDCATKSGVSKPTIANIENEVYEPENSTVSKLESCFRRHGIFWSETTIEKRDAYVAVFHDYLAVLADIEETLPEGGEVLVHCADDTRSSEAVNAALRGLKQKGCTFRVTICEGNTTIAGDIRDYKWIPKDYFAESEVSVIYGPKVCQHVAGEPLFTVITSESNAALQRRQFEYWWKNGRAING